VEWLYTVSSASSSDLSLSSYPAPRPQLVRAARPAVLRSFQPHAPFTTTLRAMGEGDTGAPLRGGGQGDAFHKREKANEDYIIRQREQEKLKELKRKLAEQHEHLKKLEEHIDEITKSSGGEQN